MSPNPMGKAVIRARPEEGHTQSWKASPPPASGSKSARTPARKEQVNGLNPTVPQSAVLAAHNL